MKPQITALVTGPTNMAIALQKSCGMKPQITHRKSSSPAQANQLQKSCGMKPQITITFRPGKESEISCFKRAAA